MKKWIKSWKGILCLVLLALLLLTCGAVCAQDYWLYQQPKFHDLTVELGTESISLRQFMTEYAQAGKVGFVTDPGEIDLDQVGTRELTLRHGRQEQTVKLTIQDTTPPQVQFQDRVVVYASQELPKAEDLVVSCSDLSQYSIAYLQEPVFPEDYRDAVVTVVVTDTSGNETRGQCTLCFRWMLESLTLELGQELKLEDILLNPNANQPLVDPQQIAQVNESGIGSYTVTSLDGSTSCQVTVVDTTPPQLELRSLERLIGHPAKLEDFVVSVSDLAGIKEVRLMTELSFYMEQSFTVIIEAEDVNGNITTGQTTLDVIPDRVPPEMEGLKAMLVAKNSTPDFITGVRAYDWVTGECTFTVDTTGLDLTKTGVYYIVYTTADANGNVGTYRRKVEVEHDASDTAALVQSVASQISGNDPVAIKRFVYGYIGYSHDWGGNDPVWFGLTNRRGNCYVHALTLQRLLNLKGYETQLIWTTNQSHYWLLIKIGDGWKHIDSTPSPQHQRYPLMSDAQRMETLDGRSWDTSKWPACE